MRILVLSFPHKNRFGTREKQIISLIGALKKRGYAFFYAGSCQILIKKFTHQNWHRLPLWFGWEPLSPLRAFIYLIISPLLFIELLITLVIFKFKYKINAVVCLTLSEKLLIAPSAKILGLKIYFVESALIDRWLTPNPLRYLYRFNAKFATVITATDIIKKQLVDIGVKANKIFTIHHGIDPSNYQVQGSIWQNIVSGKQPHNQKTFVVGTVTHLVADKGVAYLLQAAQIALRHIPQLQIIIIGNGEERNNLMWLAEQLKISDRVVFIGWQENLGRWLMRFDIFALPSIRKEGFGLTLLEVMAHGKPIIASKVGSIPEIVESGKGGMLVEPKNPEMIAQAIINLYQHPEWREEIGANNVNKINTYFHVDRMIDQYMQIFNS